MSSSHPHTHDDIQRQIDQISEQRSKDRDAEIAREREGNIWRAEVAASLESINAHLVHWQSDADDGRERLRQVEIQLAGITEREKVNSDKLEKNSAKLDAIDKKLDTMRTDRAETKGRLYFVFILIASAIAAIGQFAAHKFTGG